YFNGSWVKVSLHQHAGEAAAFKITTLKVTPAIENGSDQPSNARTITNQKEVNQSANAAKVSLPAYAKAVGRFTNGLKARGAGWIAANGAIVTDYEYVMEYYDYHSLNDDYSPEVYDVIEFNMPPSNPDGSINHAAPEDQYPINTNHVFGRIIAGKHENDYGPDFIRIKIASWWDHGYVNVQAGYSIVDVLPNGTGKYPGENIQEYFQVARHPSGKTMDEQILSILHTDLTKPINLTKRNTVTRTNAIALNPNDKVRSVSDKDRFLLYDHAGHIISKETLGSVSSGAPVTYEGSNVAIGIVNVASVAGYGFGIGFRDDEFRRHLGEFFSDKTTYVDPNSYWNEENGTIDKPYLTIANAAQNVDEDGVLSIVRGSYDESVVLNTPMKVKTPLGAVIIGSPQGSNTRWVRPTLPAELFTEDEVFAEEEDLLVAQSPLKSFPNPFTQHTELHYTLKEDSPVVVKVYDMLGQEVQTLVEEEQLEGEHHLQWDGRNYQGQNMPSGLYIMQLKTSRETSSVRVMKQ
ncbi:MAG: FlgD immunoglobulin-like domain containing protein, partial [Cyclobacteriaceae bacterium]